MNKNITIVTGFWNLNVDAGLDEDNLQYAKDKEAFFKLLKCDMQMCIWIPSELNAEVLRIRADKPTKVFIKELYEFRDFNPFFEKIQEIRKSEEWLNEAEWLKNSKQAKVEYYNTVEFMRMEMLNYSANNDIFGSEYCFWIDPLIAYSVDISYFNDVLVLNNLDKYVLKNNKKFINIVFPYSTNNEIHGFKRKEMADYCGVDFVNQICNSRFFGGSAKLVNHVSILYREVIEETLKNALMGNADCIFTILIHKYPDLIKKFYINSSTSIYLFFEELNKYKFYAYNSEYGNLDIENTALYVITFNSPKQFKTLIESMLSYDKEFINAPSKFLLDNSTDESTLEDYKAICSAYNFTHIKKQNLGICGGRQFIANHADENNFDYYFFFEDDMFFYPHPGSVCKNGFNRFVENFYRKSLNIIDIEKFDFLKLSFTEFFGNNSKQWSWYNVSQKKREEFWPEYSKLPTKGIDINSPNTEFKNIKINDGIPYVNGEIYYSNWPQVVSKIGNRKMFLETKWDYPHEQTWMAYIYEQTKLYNIYPGLLLISPTEHDRFEHYAKELRKEC